MRSPRAPTAAKQPDPPGRQAADNWTIRESASFRNSPLPGHLKDARRVIEARARLLRYTYAGKYRLAYEYGKCRGIEGGIRQWERCVDALIEDGTILTVNLRLGRRKRAMPLIVLLERIDDRLDVFRPDRDCLICLVLDHARDRITEQRSLPRQECPHSQAQREAALATARMRHPCRDSSDIDDANLRHPCRDFAQRHLLEVLKEDALKKDEPEKTTTTVRTGSREPHAREAGPPPSSFFSSPRELRTGPEGIGVSQPKAQPPATGRELADLAELMKRAESLFRQPMRRKVELAINEFGCAILGKALTEAENHPRKKIGNKPVESWGWVLRTCSNMRNEQEADSPLPIDPPQAPPEKPPAASSAEPQHGQPDPRVIEDLRIIRERLANAVKADVQSSTERQPIKPIPAPGPAAPARRRSGWQGDPNDPERARVFRDMGVAHLIGAKAPATPPPTEQARPDPDPQSNPDPPPPSSAHENPEPEAAP